MLIRALKPPEELEAGYAVLRELRTTLPFSDFKNLYQAAHQADGYTVSMARRIVGVITKENACEWISMAENLKQKELEEAVAAVSPKRGIKEGVSAIAKDLSKLTAVLTKAEERELTRVAHLVSQKLKKSATFGEVISAMTKLYLEKHDPVERAKRASVTSQTEAPTSSRTSPMNHVNSPPRRGRVPIPAFVKHKVHLRDGFRCTWLNGQGTRCDSQRFLELHHKLPVALGGANTVENLITVCWAHHRGEHLGVPWDRTG